MITDNYSTLVNETGSVVQKILPNIEFDELAPNCINTAYCVIKDKEGVVVHILAPGARTPEKELAKSINYDEMSKSELRELLIQAEISFPTKATKVRLIELLC